LVPRSLHPLHEVSTHFTRVFRFGSTKSQPTSLVFGSTFSKGGKGGKGGKAYNYIIFFIFKNYYVK